MSTKNAAVSSETVAERNRKLLKSGQHSDYTIRCTDRDFKVHKLILQNAGGYFEGALNGSFQEATANVTNLDDCDSEVVHAMLQYIYHDDYEIENCSKAQKVDQLNFHAKVDRLGKRMLLDGLQEQAVNHLKDDLVRNQSPELLETALFNVSSYEYNYAAASGDAFRTVIAKAIAHAAYATPSSDRASRNWSDTFKDSNPLASDLIQHGIDPYNAKLTNSSQQVTKLQCNACGDSIWILVELDNVEMLCPFCQIHGCEQPLERLGERLILDAKFP